MANDDIHVYPTNDLKEHVTEGIDCLCNPRVEVIGATLLIVHNAWDNRELIEQVVYFLNIQTVEEDEKRQMVCGDCNTNLDVDGFCSYCRNYK